METLLTPDELADLIGCTTDDLKNWRRLPPEHPGRLPSTLVDGRHRYDPNVLVTWLVTNPKRLAVACFLLEERRAMLPLALGIPVTPAGNDSTPVGLGLLGGFDYISEEAAPMEEQQ